jgi:putative transposase
VERDVVLDVLHDERFVDKAPAEVFATLLDEKEQYLCSIRTMYRILEANQEVRERRNQRRHPKHAKPVLVARSPNQVWTWDITKLRGPQKWLVYYLYALLDIFSRYVVGWTVAEYDSSALAKRLIGETCAKQGVGRGELTIHADRGSAMTAGTVLDLYSLLGVTPSHNRPRVSNDNPYSESQFKTLKYRPEFPDRFGSLEHARSFCRGFFHWYNVEHHHSGLALLTPNDVHHGRVGAVLAKRQRSLDLAHAAHPERFVNGRPIVPKPPKEVWINQPGRELVIEEKTH